MTAGDPRHRSSPPSPSDSIQPATAVGHVQSGCQVQLSEKPDKLRCPVNRRSWRNCARCRETIGCSMPLSVHMRPASANIQLPNCRRPVSIDAVLPSGARVPEVVGAPHRTAACAGFGARTCYTCRCRSRWTTVGCPLGSALGDIYTAVPNIAPTPAVTAMANVPQNATRSALFKGGVPPTAAAAAPSMARKTIAVATTQ